MFLFFFLRFTISYATFYSSNLQTDAVESSGGVSKTSWWAVYLLGLCWSANLA